MYELDTLIDLFIGNVKKLFYPGEWVEIDLKFSKSEIFTMLFLDKRKEATMSELVEYINSPMSTATGIVDRLVRNKLVKRERSDIDRRIVLLSLTEEGSKFISKLRNMINNYVELIIDELTEEEKQFLINIIFKILNNLEKKLPVKIPESSKENTVRQIDIE